MKKLITNKRGGFTDLFLLLIFSLIIVFFSVLFIYMGGLVKTQLHNSMDNMTFGDANVSQVIDNTMGQTVASFDALRWISFLLIGGMIISIFIGSYLVTTKPIFLLPYIIIVIVAIIVSVVLANAYETVSQTPELASTFATFGASNYFFLYLPIWITIIGLIGGIIMFSRIGRYEYG